MRDETPVCANCGILIRWLPTVVDGKTYCCLGCARGGPCECDYHHLPHHTDRAHIVVRYKGIIERRAVSK
jgi:hypothetical protein